MNYWEFTSNENWFNLRLPGNWSESDEDEGTYGFFNTEQWSGNLRITPIRWTDNDGTDKAHKAVLTELAENSEAALVKIKDWDTAFYTEELTDGAIGYYWVTGLNNNLFICSFSFNKEFRGTDWHDNELLFVEDILNSIGIIG